MAKYLVVGFGSIGKRHARNLRALRPMAHIIGVDPVATPQPGVEDEWVDEFYSDADAAPTPDAVIISSPHELHAENMQTALRYGVPAFIEKPLGSTGSFSKWVLLADAARALPCAVGFNYRYHPAVAQSRDNWIAGRRAEFVAADSLPQYGPTVAETMGSHAMDLAIWTLGLPITVDLVSTGVKLTGRITHANGYSTYNHDMAGAHRISVVYGAASATWLTPAEHTYRDELADWLTWIEMGHKPDRLATLADGLLVQAVLEQVKHG